MDNTSAFLAIDIGASSGRHILGEVINGRLELSEIHRFGNEMIRCGSQLCWDVDALFEEIIIGLSKCKRLGKIPKSIGIDTWGVDFVLLDSDGKRIGNAVAYRDDRTKGMDTVLQKYISEAELYAKTGIQKMPFNTIYQMLALKQQEPDLLAKAQSFLFMPEYLSYLLTGIKKHEYTIASTSNMINALEKKWDFDIINRAGLPSRLFGNIAAPGEKLGSLLAHIQERIGFDCDVVYPCMHDTASAVVCAPIDDSSIYLSSGTWSLIGVELDQPICTEESRLANLTNEGGYKDHTPPHFDCTYRYMKNIMGLWIIQCVKKELRDEYSFEKLCNLAQEAVDFSSVIDVNHERFLSPNHMITEIQSACEDARMPIPHTPGEIAKCVFLSLAACYAKAVEQIASITKRIPNKICIIGGGSQNVYLNQLTATAAGIPVTTGPVEATAAGNILVQMIAAGLIKDITAARALEIVTKA